MTIFFAHIIPVMLLQNFYSCNKSHHILSKRQRHPFLSDKIQTMTDHYVPLCFVGPDFCVCNALYGDHSSFVPLGASKVFQASLSMLRACSPHQTVTPLLISVPMASHRRALQSRLNSIISQNRLEVNRTNSCFVVSFVLQGVAGCFTGVDLIYELVPDLKLSPIDSPFPSFFQMLVYAHLCFPLASGLSPDMLEHPFERFLCS